MKYGYILIAAIVVGGIIWFLAGNEPQSDTTPTSETNTEDAAPTSDTEPASETDDTSDVDVEGGTDAGMEFPTIDADNSASAETSRGEGDDTTETHVIDMVGTNYAFDLTEIRVQAGDTVTINFTSGEGFHDWVVDQFDAATERVRSGETASVTFVADEAGTYEYYCSVGSHREQGMVGTLIVE